MTNTTAAADRAAYDAWVETQLALIRAEGDATNSGFDIWDTAKVRRAQRRGIDRDWSEAGGFSGPWHIVKAYATQEFIWWVEGGNARWTFAAWQAAQRAERASEQAHAEDPARNLDTLAYIRDMEARKGEYIAAARAGGSTWAEIMAATGMSRQSCNTYARSYTHPAVAEVVPAAAVPAESADDVAYAAAAGYASYAEFIDAEAF
jgi:hypothetical protein